MNLMSNHPITRQALLNWLRGMRRSSRRLQIQLNGRGPLTPEERKVAHEDAKVLYKAVKIAIRMLDDAKPPPQEGS